MNKLRRKAIELLSERMETIKEELETIRDEEQEYFENMPESLQGSEKGEAAEEILGSLEDSLYDMTTAIDSMQEI